MSAPEGKTGAPREPGHFRFCPVRTPMLRKKMSRPKSGMVSNDLVRGRLFRGGFLLGVLVSCQKLDADLIARESYQATAAICETRRPSCSPGAKFHQSP
jgi:hypothetical protein